MKIKTDFFLVEVIVRAFNSRLVNRVFAILLSFSVVQLLMPHKAFADGNDDQSSEDSGTSSANSTYNSAAQGGAYTGDAQNKMGTMINNAFHGTAGGSDSSGSSGGSSDSSDSGSQ